MFQIGIAEVRVLCWKLNGSMIENKQDEEEFERMAEQLDNEIIQLGEVLDKFGDEMDRDYATKIMRSQLEEIGDLTESMSHKLGAGEVVSVTTPTDINEGDE